MDKTNLILNSTIELVDVQEEGNGKGRPFVSRFIEPGIAHYKELGDILITKETLNKFINTMVGCPVIIEHEDVTDANADKLRVGVVSRVWFNEADGYFYCEGILTDPEAIDLVKNQGYNVSCAYSFVSDNTKRIHNGKEIDMEFIDGEFLHLALVKDPRYEGANIVVNKNDNDGKWITIKPNSEDGKGRHLLLKDGESPKEAMKRQWGVDVEKKSEISDLLEEQKDSGEEIEIDQKDLDWIKTQPMEKIPTLIETYKKIKREKIETEKKRQQVLKEQAEKQREEKRKRDKELLDKYEKGKELSEKKAQTMTLEEYLDSRGVKARKGAIYELHRYDWEQAQKQSDEQNKKATNSIGDITMQVLNELKDFIKSVVSNEKEEEMKEVKNEDKRKLIDEVGGILKGKVDEELWRTVVGKLEKIAYEPSEDDKADNEDDEKEAKNKCKNEDEKTEKKEDVTKNEDKPKDDGEDKPKDKAENKKVKNSMRDMVMGGSSNVQEQKLYISRKERLEEGNKY